MTKHSIHANCQATGKSRFRDHEEAVDALRHAKTSRHNAMLDGVMNRRNEVRSYSCDHCKGWHLTSWAGPSTPPSVIPLQRAPMPSALRLAGLRGLGIAS